MAANDTSLTAALNIGQWFGQWWWSSGGQVVVKWWSSGGQVLAFYSNDPNSNPAEVNSFHVKFVLEKIKMNKDV